MEVASRALSGFTDLRIALRRAGGQADAYLTKLGLPGPGSTEPPRRTRRSTTANAVVQRASFNGAAARARRRGGWNFINAYQFQWLQRGRR